jgi:hypothetical protein
MSDETKPMTWREMKKAIEKATEDQCKEILKNELNGPKRWLFVNRIYGRFCRLREQRERDEYMLKCLDAKQQAKIRSAT